MKAPVALLATSLLLAACGEAPSVDAPPPAAAPAKAEMTSLERGRILYKRCRACHTLGEGERHKVGPNLWGIYGATAGAREDFNYSKAMTASGVVWDDDTLSAYIEKPSTYMPGNRMSFAGLRKPEDRAAVLEYLKAETGG